MPAYAKATARGILMKEDPARINGLDESSLYKNIVIPACGRQESTPKKENVSL